MEKVLLVVRDGWGYSEETVGNAVRLADTPVNDRLMKTRPWVLLNCAGNAVGLPEGTQGGSEPGHLIMGAGRVVLQPLKEINQSIKDGSFFSNKALMGAINHCLKGKGRLHLMGLLSDQGIHGTITHLSSLLELARMGGLNEVFIHGFLDGRDTPVRSAKKYLQETLRLFEEVGVGRIASLVGRYYAMDRDTNWGRTEKAYHLLTLGIGHLTSDPLEAVSEAYRRGDDTDYYIQPTVVTDKNGKPIATIEDGDSVIFWNFRSERARQITYALTQVEFDAFLRKKIPQVHFTCMSVYDRHLDLPVAFPQKKVKNNLGGIIASNGLRQLRIAESEKYAQVTYFFNSQEEDVNIREDRIMIPSLKVPSYENDPVMKAHEVTDKLIQEVQKGFYEFILVNYANGDLVGHSANYIAGLRAVETVDLCLGRLLDNALHKDYTVLVTGDHGNIETMLYPNGEPNPSHGLNPVPFILVSDYPDLKGIQLKSGRGLANVAPTVLDLMGIEKPREMTAESLIIRA
ncbi:MAG: 2,3-bisphosphoglycerate-independent phosphoglycerate mutase [Candidatus Bathyarchaeota archaeon]|jgi:2,3-bisphosphoglycerate-independent phosphoglycerate mutase|nr:2,3-bisphosphoglycerate-independent phosphoglycerate mutase [Candidatus Bathyarchaeota archaeon]